MKKYLILFTFLIVAVVLFYDRNASSKTVYSFYHWTSSYKVDANETKAPRYVKVLDIAYGKTLVFQKTLFKTTPRQKVVPVIYLDNPLWQKMKAQTVSSKVLEALESMPISYDEIQVDCDWTERSKERYFTFLKMLKEKSAKKVSVTIRLHQVKYYRNTGVPPVDYGVLMYYNMSDFRDIESRNYILDLELAKQYHFNFDSYPLALNLALPLYSQATIIRFSKVAGLMEGVREKELTKHFKKLKGHLFEVQETHYFKGRLFYKGDKVRVDEVSMEMLRKSMDELKIVMKQPKEVIFYRWENAVTYGEKNLKYLVESW